MRSILVVEDNQDLARGLSENLQMEGYRVRTAPDGQSALDELRSATHDLVILDLMLPALDGFGVLRTLRHEGNDVPVLVLTARGELDDKVRGFRIGCDDYLTKPFALLELLSRVNALLRRAQPGRPAAMRENDRFRFGDIEIHSAARLVYRRGVPIRLRPKEYELLMALVARNGGVISRTELLHQVWGYKAGVVSRTVDTHVAELRRKLEDDPSRPRYVVTVPKSGLRLRRE